MPDDADDSGPAERNQQQKPTTTSKQRQGRRRRGGRPKSRGKRSEDPPQQAATAPKQAAADAATIDAAATNATPPQPTTAKPQRPRNRPGFNSYLKVILDPPTMEFLHHVTRQLQQDVRDRAVATATTSFETVNNDRTESSTREEAPDSNQQPQGGEREATVDGDTTGPPPTPTATPPTPPKRPPRPLSLKPRSLPSLHLTFFFGGETLCALSAAELSLWHSQIAARLARAGFGSVQQENTSPQTATIASELPSSLYGMRIREFKVFPPGRNNLVVALLEVSDAWQELYRDIREIAKQSDCQPLVDITGSSKERWTPHVTLANLQGGKGPDKTMLREMLSNVNYTDASGEDVRERWMQPLAIQMGGPIPDVIELDWDFPAQKQQH